MCFSGKLQVAASQDDSELGAKILLVIKDRDCVAMEVQYHQKVLPKLCEKILLQSEKSQVSEL